ncbi:uncharacterized protein LOC116134945 [Pistacia vera]|uniref:uncharacterized protein LOC116134945 n=1 Tax=Pistacia vera TaxID=55513 RepID=UPI0012631076|nr:uncharacterized protein LOC116134945 [Pistacia vera]
MDTFVHERPLKLKLEESVSNVWPEFGSNGKDLIEVHHVLNHTSGLHNALVKFTSENPTKTADWDDCLRRIAESEPETEPGQQQVYNYLSFGWLCGGIIEHASGKKFQEILEEAFIRPLNIEGELYVGIPPESNSVFCYNYETEIAVINGNTMPFNGYPPGVESRLASLEIDEYDLNKYSKSIYHPNVPFDVDKIAELITDAPVFFNMLNTRRSILPATNGHCSARAVARYYAALADGGVIPPPHSSLSKPPLGSHTHIPKFPSQEKSKKPKGKKSREVPTASKKNTNNNGKEASGDGYTVLTNNDGKIFRNPKIHDAFLGVGDYDNLALPNGEFGLGFKRSEAEDGSLIGFGHSGVGGSTGFCDIKNRFAIAVSLNKLSYGAATAKIIDLVCSELNIPLPVKFSSVKDSEKPLIH